MSASDGTSPYTYKWDDALAQTTATATGLSAGTYNVTVTDNHSCTITKSVSVSQPAAALTATTSKVDVLCYGNSTGSATVSASDGTSPYTYKWDDALAQTTATATGLSAGTYNVTITDNHSCTITKSVSVSQPDAALAATTSKVDVLCYGNSTGSATVSASDGTSPYTYKWDDALARTTATATGLSAGTVQRDGNGQPQLHDHQIGIGQPAGSGTYSDHEQG